MTRRWRRILGWLASAALLAAAVFVVRDRWSAVSEAGGLPGPGPVAYAVVAYVGGNVLLALNWRGFVAMSGSRPPFRLGLWIWSISQLARYTVTLGHVAGRGVVARRYGLTATTGAAAAVLELVYILSISSGLALATLPWWLSAVGNARWLAIAGAGPFVLLIATLIAPSAIVRLAGQVVRTRFGRWLTRGRLTDLPDRVEVSRGRIARIAARYLANTTLRLSAFLVLFRAVGGDLGAHALQAIGAYAVGHLAGGLAFFAPGGLGAREGATLVAIAPALGDRAGLLLVAAVRLLEVAAELLLLGIARLVRGPVPEARE